MGRNAANRSGVHHWCLACRRADNNARNRANPQRKRDAALQIKYGITAEDRARILEAQGGGCAICQERSGRLCVDHCHETGRVRGLLCISCNTKVYVLDAWPHRQQAASYLKPNGPQARRVSRAHRKAA